MQSPPDSTFDPPFVLTEPMRQSVPVVFNAPHAGRVYPPNFLASSRLDPLSLRRSEDAHVDLLFGPIVRFGAPLMSARFPRAYLDVNREPYELDPRMFDGPLPAYANSRSMRVAGGLGTIPRIVADGHDIYRARLPVAAALQRIEHLYKPYHRVLRHLATRTLRQFGTVVLVDCHSMPSTSLPRHEGQTADIVLGDRYGTSCDGRVTDLLEALFSALGYTVARNKPYAGGFITEHYGAPATFRHAIQVEINRGLYMDERTLEPNEGWATLAEHLTQVFGEFVARVATDSMPRSIAAE
ncbi:N-formylglutamate amidohydrolase [Chelatococcus reniformis]|uniref:N-formylglutamate amidohydrolase n=1 Tax=Chelatococcus reniformis TaxID=1494448 RepID=A0A916U7X2_9HYPH|nr:N-formylglutamate amidohydrolase [Chelatococcus reniformis]GGC63945.1 N-formylglutamate amidohydrolase [Chelatococcus reniformis]